VKHVKDFQKTIGGVCNLISNAGALI